VLRGQRNGSLLQYSRISRPEPLRFPSNGEQLLAKSGKLSVSAYSVTENQITQPQAVIIGQVTAERNAPLLSRDEGQCDPLLPVKGEIERGIFYIYVLYAISTETFSTLSAPLSAHAITIRSS
jgi:hypothetical protein